MYKKSTSEKCSLHSYHRKLSQNSIFFIDHCFQRRLLRNWYRMTRRPLCALPASLWLVLVSPRLTQFCVLSRCHKLVLNCQERYPWTPSCSSSFFPVELSRFEYITSLERIVFAQWFWQDLFRESAFERFKQWFQTQCQPLLLQRFSKEYFCFTRFASCHRDLLRDLVRSFSHVPGRCSTSFTNNLEHVTTFSYLDSFYRLDLSLPKKGISKTCSHIRASDSALLLTLGRLKQIY